MLSSEILHRLATFVEDECIPSENLFVEELEAIERRTGSRWTEIPRVMTQLQAKAKSLGLWNLFMPKVKLDHSQQ